MLHRTLNLGILAHVDAGKTTLTERLLFTAGAITELGSVDEGTTRTDTLRLEQQRGITIKSAVASLSVDGLCVNLVDTPGHPDFIAEVDRALEVLDGAVLVLSAVEGVQSHSRILMRALQRLGVPTIIFVNKIDRRGARDDEVLHDIEARLARAIVPLGTTSNLGTREADFHPFDGGDATATTAMVEVLAEHDEELLTSFLEDGDVTVSRLRAELAVQSRRGVVYPVLFGSAKTGNGVEALLSCIAEYLPTANGEPDGPAAGTVFKIERGANNEKISYVRMRSGTIAVRDRVELGHAKADTVTSIQAFDGGTLAKSSSICAGEIGRLWGLRGARIGDRIGPASSGATSHFAPPTLASVVVARSRDDRVRLGSALAQLAEQDPLINVRLDPSSQEISVSLYGEVQKEVIGSTLCEDFGIEVDFLETSTICVERPVGSGQAAEHLLVAPNPFLATIGLRVDPAAFGSGVAYRREPGIVGLMPNAYFRAVEDTVRETLRQGLRGWEVTDCTVTLTHAGFLGKHGLGHQYFNKSMSSTGEDFRKLAPLVVMTALRRAGTVVCEPIHWFVLEVPIESLELVTPSLRALRAITQSRSTVGVSCSVTGLIPAGSVHGLQQRLADLTRGEGVAETGLDHFAQVMGDPPARRRLGLDPLDRAEYLKRLGVRGAGSRAVPDG